MSASIEKTRDSLSDCQSALNTVFENLNDCAMEDEGVTWREVSVR